LLAGLAQLAHQQRPDAVLLASSDEFFEVADGSDLRTAMEEDFAAGYNVLEFANMEFQMTTEDDPSDPDALSRMRYYNYRPASMPRAYLWLSDTDAAAGRGHRVDLPEGVDVRVSPRRYVSRHYPLRTEQQAREKIARMITKDPTETLPARYLRIWLEPENLYAKPRRLSRYRDDRDWVFEDKTVATRLKQTEGALAKLFLAAELTASVAGRDGATQDGMNAIDVLHRHVLMIEERQWSARATERERAAETDQARRLSADVSPM
jgi:hypothetical protein